MFSYWIHDWSPYLFQIGDGFGLRWYGLSYVLAFFTGYLLYAHLAKRGLGPLKPDQVGDFITWAALFGVILGGRIGYLLFYTPGELAANPLLFFKLWEGGMASHGGIAGLFFFTLYYSRRHRISWTGLGDNLVVVSPVGIFFGRVANFINGELYGRATTVPWAIQFPKELLDMPYASQEAALRQMKEADPAVMSLAQAVESLPYSPQMQEVFAAVLTPRHPSQLYAAFLEGLVLFTVLWLMRTQLKLRNGVLTGFFFIGYGLLRIVGEVFREPDAALTAGLTRGQFLSVFLLVIGAVFIFAAKRPRDDRP